MKSLAIAAGLAAALAVVPMAAPAASASAPAADGQRMRHRMELACKRVPHAIERTEKLQTRLAADAGTRGSLAWLTAAQQKASANGHAERAQLLGSRLKFRQELAGILPDRLTWLKQAQTLCSKDSSTSTTSGTSS